MRECGEERREKAASEPKILGTPSLEEALRLIHELQVHQAELNIKNEELREAQDELEASRARYFDLYDLAPVGYFTVSEQGTILEANLTAAKLLGIDRSTLLAQPLTRFVVPGDRESLATTRQAGVRIRRAALLGDAALRRRG